MCVLCLTLVPCSLSPSHHLSLLPARRSPVPVAGDDDPWLSFPTWWLLVPFPRGHEPKLWRGLWGWRATSASPYGAPGSGRCDWWPTGPWQWHDGPSPARLWPGLQPRGGRERHGRSPSTVWQHGHDECGCSKHAEPWATTVPGQQATICTWSRRSRRWRGPPWWPHGGFSRGRPPRGPWWRRSRPPGWDRGAPGGPDPGRGRLWRGRAWCDPS